ncbi:hypothetical protein PG984_012583 [Apiospora sp. TS-2023a]
MNPLRELGKLGDAITALEKSGIQVLLAGKGIRALCDGIRTPTADSTPVVLAVIFKNITANCNDALVKFFAKLRCGLNIRLPPFAGNEPTYVTHPAANLPTNSNRPIAEYVALRRVSPRVWVLLPWIFTPTKA